MRDARKKPHSDLRKYYTVFLELGLVVVLVLFIVAMKVDFQGSGNTMDMSEEQEVVEMEEIIQTQQEETPPPPPRPQVPVEVPNDEVIEDQEINLDADMNLDEPLDLPPPPDDGGSGDGEEEDFFVAVQDEPELIGGIQALQKKIEYPDQARKAGIEGQVIVRFIVNEDGSVVDPEIVRGLPGGLNEAAIKGIMEHAKFKPGQQQGEPVRVQYTLPITFRLSN